MESHGNLVVLVFFMVCLSFLLVELEGVLPGVLIFPTGVLEIPLDQVVQ